MGYSCPVPRLLRTKRDVFSAACLLQGLQVGEDGVKIVTGTLGVGVADRQAATKDCVVMARSKQGDSGFQARKVHMPVEG